MTKNIKTHKGFTLIELLVVLAIIGIISSVGIVAYNGYTNSAKRNATIAQHKIAVKFIKHKMALCMTNGGGSLPISSKYSINCDVDNNASGINDLNNIFIDYFLDQGWKNPYGDKNPVVYAGRNGSKDFNGRMRFDETECASGSSKKQISLWVKTHKNEDYKPTLISMDGWCN